MTNAIERPAVPAPSHVGQATAIEQSRAAAEVAAAVHVAQQNPRDMQKAMAEMRESCRQLRLAEKSFFRYKRGGGQVTGATVHLARELARCFGNVQYGIAELRRDDAGGYSEMQAYAWDVERNTRSAQIFVVPHARDTTKDGRKPLVDLRDIYENNANMGARRLRAAIWAILPPWFVDEAEELCNQTLADGGGVPLPKRIADWIAAFGRQGVSVLQLEQKLGRPSDRWTEHDVAQLSVIGKSVARGESRLEDEFPPEQVTANEILGSSPAKAVACGFSTPDGACNLPPGHPTGPELDGYDGHDVIPNGGAADA